MDEIRVKELADGTPVGPDVSEEELTSVLAAGAYRPTGDDCAGFDVAAMDATALTVGLRPGVTVVVESTTCPGTTESVVRSIPAPAVLLTDHGVCDWALLAEYPTFILDAPHVVPPGTGVELP